MPPPSSPKYTLDANDAWSPEFWTVGNKAVLAEQAGITDATQEALDLKANTADLGGAATLDVGATTGTVAAGNDSRFRPWIAKSGVYQAVNLDMIQADTTAAGFTITLPATPTVNMQVDIADALGTFATNNLTVASDGSIDSDANDLVIDVSGVHASFVFAGGTVGWAITCKQASVGYLTVDQEARDGAPAGIVTTIALSAESVAVVFPVGKFTATPSISFSIEKADGADPDIWVTGFSGLTTAGCTAYLSSITTLTTYKLHTSALKI